MGVLTDFVIAGSNDAQMVGEAKNPSKDFTGIDAKGMDQIKMGTLYSLLTRSAYDPDFMASDDSFLYNASEDGPWVQMVPTEMTTQLANISESQILAIAEEWGNTEEFDPKYSSWNKEDIVTFLRDIAKLSRLAQSENKSLFMWTCL